MKSSFLNDQRFANFLLSSRPDQSHQLEESGQLAYLGGPACAVLWRHNSAHKDAMFVVTLVLCDTKCASEN